MALVSELIDECKRYLYSGNEDEKNRLASSVLVGDTTMTMAYDLKGISPGAVLAIDLEEIRVWEVSGKTLGVVERGINGSTPAAHNSLATVTVRPKFSNFRIFQAMNHDLRDLSSPQNGLFRVATDTITYNPAVQGYDLTTLTTNQMMSILELAYDEPGPYKSLPTIDTYSIRRNLTTDADFPSGTALILYEAGFPGKLIRVSYTAPFVPWTLPTQTHTDAGLPDTAIDIPPLGAAIRLVAPRDVKRSFGESQGEPRRADEVQVGAAASATRGLMMMRQARILAEASRLEKLYPKEMALWG